MREVLEVNSPGLLTSIQDGGRPGWRRFGIPPGGAMDRGAWHTANRMLHNALDCPVLECLQGASLRVLEETAVATSGAWGALAWTARPGEIIEFPPSLAGVWHYLALPGGIEAALAGHPAVAECAVIGVADDMKGQLPAGFVVLNAGVNRDSKEIEGEVVKLVRDVIGPVAAFKNVMVVKRLPKTRSGKILRGTMRAIADGDTWNMPATIDDPAILDEITETLRSRGMAASKGVM